MSENCALFIRLNDTDTTVVLWLNRAERDAFDALPPGPSTAHTVVYDRERSEHYVVLRANCGLGCYCAAKGYMVLHGSQVSTTDTDEAIAQRRSDALDEIYPARQKN